MPLASEGFKLEGVGVWFFLLRVVVVVVVVFLVFSHCGASGFRFGVPFSRDSGLGFICAVGCRGLHEQCLDRQQRNPDETMVFGFGFQFSDFSDRVGAAHAMFVLFAASLFWSYVLTTWCCSYRCMRPLQNGPECRSCLTHKPGLYSVQ